MSRKYDVIFKWPEESLEVLRRMWSQEGASASMIANALSDKFSARVSRNAVIGKVNRLGLVQHKGRKVVKKCRPVEQKPISVRRKPTPVVKDCLPTESAPAPAATGKPDLKVRSCLPVEPRPFPGPADSRRIGILGLRETTCR